MWVVVCWFCFYLFSWKVRKTTKSKKPVVGHNVWNTSRQEGVLERRPSSNDNDS